METYAFYFYYMLFICQKTSWSSLCAIFDFHGTCILFEIRNENVVKRIFLLQCL